MFLIGSSGTGKTLALVNALKTKVSFYKRQQKKLKIFLCASLISKQWAKDMMSEKYGLETIMKEYQCEPMDLEDLGDLFKGSGELDDKPFCKLTETSVCTQTCHH